MLIGLSPDVSIRIPPGLPESFEVILATLSTVLSRWKARSS